MADKDPYAIGDEVKHLQSLTDICLYGSAWVGMLASIVEITNVEGILQLNCNATDFFGKKDFPTYLIYNPYDEKKKATIQIPNQNSDLYDLVNKEYLAKNVSTQIEISLLPNSAKQ